MENIDLDTVLLSLVVAILVFKYFEARAFFRQQKQNSTHPQEATGKTANCIVEYDPNDPDHNMLYIFDRRTKQFLTQARTIREALTTLVKQGYDTITFHPDHCPPEIFEQTKKITINDFKQAIQ